TDDPDVGPALCGWSCCLLFVGLLLMNSARESVNYVAMPMMQQHAVHVAPQMAMQPTYQNVPGVPVQMSHIGGQVLGSAAPVPQQAERPPLIPLSGPALSGQSQQTGNDSHNDLSTGALSAERREELYEAHLVSALVEGAISEKEDQHLSEMRSKYGISDEQNDAMVRRLGHDPSTLEILKKALAIEESGRYADAAALYEAAGQHERANMLRMKAKAMDSNKGNVVQQTTYNIKDSAVTGGIAPPSKEDDF
ncbi:MAG TPA: hypothetical protein QF646_03290, partial [Candidatus Poseidoniales archaeon]|nr:hypothetical protein [Candidatus Poseidoniales archaeon]